MILGVVWSIEQRGPFDQRESSARIALPDGDVISRDRQPSERKHVAAGLGDPSGLVPIDLVDHGGKLPRQTMPAEGCRSYPMRCRTFAREDFALAEPKLTKSPTVESALTTDRNADAQALR
ncbi:hypothetical protein [Bradyrhizobium oligotrophicum]|uniref:hypothetical protein n=1 Tax=Bradyrhizobium oligotrophicum TaxID=44255 RepID=UPI003EBC1320